MGTRSAFALAATLVVLAGVAIGTGRAANVRPAAAAPTATSISRLVGSHLPAYQVRALRDGAATAGNPIGAFSARFAGGGVTVTASGARLRLGAARLVGGRAARPGSATVRANVWADSVGGVGEWWVNGPLGLEQGFRVPGPASGAVTLSMPLRLGPDLRARLADGATALDVLRSGRVALRYSGLRAVDADGRSLAATLALAGGSLLIRVHARGAAFPIAIDPIVQAGILTATDGDVGDGLGTSVAVSGSTVALGAPMATVNGQTDAGAVYVFSEPKGGWANATQTAKLTLAAPNAGDMLGSSVAISGTTVLAGAPMSDNGDNDGAGNVFAFAEPAAGWTSESETATLSASDASGDAGLGYSLAASGTTVVAGAPYTNMDTGNAYVFVEPHDGWANATQTAELTPESGGLDFGQSVAIAGDEIAVGAPLSGSEAGEVDEFSEPAGGWANATPTATLTASDGQSFDDLGWSVAATAGTVVGGAPGATVAGDAGAGIVYVFAEPKTGWVSGTQAAELTSSAPVENAALGQSLGTNGADVVAGAPGDTVGSNTGQGAVYVFDEPSSGWVSAAQPATLSGAAAMPGDLVGDAVAASGGTVITGAPGSTVGSNQSQGEGYVFTGAPAPAGSSGVSAATGTTGPAGSSAPAELARVISIAGGDDRALVELLCPSKKGDCAKVTVSVRVVEDFRGTRLVAVKASSSGSRRVAAATATAKRSSSRDVVLASVRVTLSAGERKRVSVGLDAAGRRLVGERSPLKVSVSVVSPGRTLQTRDVKVTRPRGR